MLYKLTTQHQSDAASTSTSKFDVLPSGFLKLSQALRDENFEYNLLTCKAIFIVSKDRFVAQSTLHRARKEIDQQLSAFIAKTPRVSRGKLYFRVSDFNFKPAISMLTHLVNNTALLTPKKHLAKPSIIFELSISKKWSDAPDLATVPELSKWIKTKSKEGNAINVDYTIGIVKDPKRAEDFLASLYWPDPSDLQLDIMQMTCRFDQWYEDKVIEPQYAVDPEDNEFKKHVIEYCMEDVGDVLEHEGTTK